MFSTSVVKKPALVWSGYAIICTALLSVTTDGTTKFFDCCCDFILGLHGNSVSFLDLACALAAFILAAVIAQI